MLVTTPRGPLRLQVSVTGRASSAPLVLLHDLGGSGADWAGVVGALEHAGSCVVPDLPGAGTSERPRPDALLAAAAQAQVVLALLTALGHERAVLVGAGLGAAAAVSAVALAPERVAGLVLLGAPLHADVWPTPSVVPLLLPLLPRLLGRPEPVVATARAHDPATVEAAWRLVRAGPPRALVLWGAADAELSTSYGRRVAGELPGAAWVQVEGAGHALAADRPERVAEEIAAWL